MISSIVLFLAFVGNLFLAVYVYANNPKKPINRCFSAFILLICLWVLTVFLISIHETIRFIDFLGKMAWAITSLLPAFLVLFFLIFPGNEKRHLSTTLVLLIFVPSAFFFPISFTTLIQKQVVFENNAFMAKKGLLFPAYSLYILVYIISAALIAIIKYIRTKDAFVRLQFKYTFAGFFLLAFISSVVHIVFPLLTGSRPFFGLGASSSIVAAGFFAYAILRYRLMDIKLVFRTILVYLSMVVVITCAFVAIIHWGRLIVSPDLRDSILFGLFVSFLIALVLQPMKNFSEYLMDILLFRGRYNYHESLRDFSQQLASFLDLRGLAEFFVPKLVDTVHAKSGSLIIFYDDYSGSLTFGDKITSADILQNENSRYFLRRLSQAQDVLVRDELKRTMSDDECARIFPIFDLYNAEVITPLYLQNRLIGLIALGEKKSMSVYSVEDLNFLYTLGYQTAVTIQNAKLYNKILEMKNYNENILEQMSSGVITIDKDLRVTTFNKSAQEITGFASSRVVSREVDHIVQDELSDLLKQTLRSERGFSNRELYIKSQHAESIPINVSTSPLKEPPGVVIGALAVFNDLTDIKQLEANVRRAERLASVGTLAAGMAHEIKNPLVSLRTFAQLLPTRYDDHEFRHSFSKIAIEEVDRINNLVERLLHFARPQIPVFSLMNILPVIEESLLLVANQIERHNIYLTRHFDQSSCLIYADKEQVKQVLLNVLINAIQSLENMEERQLTISIRQSDNHAISSYILPRLPDGNTFSDSAWQIQIQDTGRGITEEDLKHIFDPFFTTNDKGYGLGLSIAHKIIQEHFGSIHVESKFGKGTSFYIHFPMVVADLAGRYRQDEILSHRIQRPQYTGVSGNYPK